MWDGLTNLVSKYPLGIKVVVWLILFSGLIALVTSGIQSWLIYQDEKRLLEQRLDNSAKIFEPALSRSLWSLNLDTTRGLLEGILRLPDVYNVSLVSSDQSVITIGSPPSGQPTKTKSYPLYHSKSDRYWLGDLTLMATLEPTRQFVIDRFFNTLIEQLFKTILVAIFLLITFRYLVSRHLEKMSRYAKQLDLDSPVRALKLDRKEPASEDELSQVVNAINSMRIRVLEQSAQLRNSERQSNLAKVEAIRDNQNKSLFITNISHELRTPMNNIVGYTGLLLNGKINAEQREYLTAVLESSEALLTMLNDMLDLSKLESGTLESHSKPLEVRALLQDAKVNALRTSRLQDLRVETYVDAELPRRIVADYDNLLRILECLLSVAIAMTDKGQTVLHVQPVASTGNKVILRFSVEDSGQGMAEAELRKILTNSFEVAVAENLPEVGVGLKLALAKELIELLGGQFGVESEVGRGTTFWFETDAELRLPDANAPNDELGRQLGKVLVADANELSLRNTLDLFGEEERQKFDIARSTADVFTLLNQVADSNQVYDAFIIDDDLDPEANSEIALVAILKGIRRSPEHHHKPVIVLSDKPNPELVKKVQANGASAYLSKLDQVQNLRDILFGLFTESTESPAFIVSPGLMQTTRQTVRGEQVTVLLVEDNKVNRDLARKMLEKCGCKVDMAENGEVALNKLKDRKFDLIFMDCWMPNMDGYETTRRIRSGDSAIAGIPIVALTANAFAGEKEKCFKVGMNRFLTKPIRFEQMAGIVKEVVQGTLDKPELADQG